jgi:hypothetical protein
MADYRILGRDTTIRMTSGGALVSEVTAIKNGSFKPVQTLLSEGFLGEPAKRHREIFEEVQVSFTIEPEGKKILEMQLDVYNRARQGQANPVQINITFRLQFPSGVVAKITVPDLQFDDIGNIDFGARESFVGMSFSAKSNRYILTV